MAEALTTESDFHDNEQASVCTLVRVVVVGCCRMTEVLLKNLAPPED